MSLLCLLIAGVDDVEDLESRREVEMAATERFVVANSQKNVSL